MAADLDFVEHVRRESARFAACLAGADATARVPTCPDWSADDLLWHLAEVQLFWGAIVRDRLQDPDAAEAAKPERPDDRAGLLELFATATAGLVDTLTTTPADTEVWTWATDHSVRFVCRRQAHEALIHRLDAELVAGDSSPIDRDLASDGVDEALAIMHGEVPPWGTFTPDGTNGTVATGDTGRVWSLAFGRFLGTGPESGNAYDLDSFTVVERAGSEPAFTLRGTAAGLDSWLWGRGPVTALAIDGDRDAFARLEQIVGRGVE